MDELIGRRIGPYEVRGLIGRGGMASVYRAFQASLNRYVAIKVLPPFMAQDEHFVARFRQEALAAGALSHPNILRIYDADTFQGQHYIVMDYVTGGALSDLMQKGPMPPDTAADLIAQIADALDYAHRRGIVHRDIKPSNILLDEEGRPLLADFGIAQAMTTGPRLTQTNTSIGTPEYMSPEQSEGRRVDGRSDLYSLGIVLYQMLTGRVPFQGHTPVATLYQVVHQAPPPIRAMAPQVPEYLESVVLRALAKSPEARFQTGREMAAALRGRRVVAPPVDPSLAETRLVGPAAERKGTPVPPAQAAPAPYTPPPGPYQAGAGGYAPYTPSSGQSYGTPLPPGAAPISQPVAAAGRRGTPVGLFVALGLVLVALAAVGFVFLKGGGQAAATPPAQTQVSGLIAPGPTDTPAASATPVVIERVITATPIPPTQTAVVVVVTFIPPSDTPPPTNTPAPTATVVPTNTSAPALAPSATKAPPPTKAASATPAVVVTPIPAAPGVLFNFENFGTWKRGVQTYGTFEQSAEKASSGRFSGKLTYAFPAVKDNFVVFQHGIAISGLPRSLSVRVLGDGGDHFLNAWVKDSQGEIRAFTFGKIPNSNEWLTVVAPLDVTAAWPTDHIEGPNNGKLDLPISFYAFVFDAVPDFGGPFNGVLYLDDLATSNESGSAGGGTGPATSGTTSGGGAAPTAVPVQAGPAPSGLTGHIIYTAAEGGSTSVYALDVATKKTWRVRTFARQGRIRGDNRIIVNGIGGGKDNLWHVGLDGGAEIQNSAHPEDEYPDWSPSGVSVVFDSTLQGDGKPRIYIQLDVSAKMEPSVMHVGAGEIFGHYATWLDNWRIAYTGCDNWASRSKCGIYATDSQDNSTPSQITDNPSDISSDDKGGVLLFSSPRNGNWEVYAVPYNGGEIRNLTNSPSHDFGGAFSPSGRQIAFMSNRDGWSIWVMNADGSGATELIAVPGGFGSQWEQERLSWGN